MLHKTLTLFSFIFILTSCSEKKTQPAKETSKSNTSQEQESREAIIAKVKQLCKKQQIRKKDIVALFPNVKITVGGMFDVYEIRESLSLHVIPGSDPDGFKIGVPTPTAFETRNTEIRLEVEQEEFLNDTNQDYTPPDLPPILSAKTAKRKTPQNPEYKYILLMTDEAEVLYSWPPK